MPQVFGCNLVKCIHEGLDDAVWRGHRLSDGAAVVVKFATSDFPTPRQKASLRNEFDIGRRLQAAGIVGISAPLELVAEEQRLGLILADVQGESLMARLGRGRLAVDVAVQLTASVAATLGAIHKCGVVHKDVKPDNIVVAEVDGKLTAWLIDFGIAMTLGTEEQGLVHPSRLEGSLPYLSPEQTGRMNRPIDYRSDYYSLGCTLFEMLTGRPPFVAEDPLELVHCHLAVQPPRVDSLIADIPSAVGDVVAHMLAKAAEDRYQTARALVADLQTAAATASQDAQAASFRAGQGDYSEKFLIPNKLYGRDADIARLVGYLGRSARGASELLLVSGWSGIGKSVLVQEVHKPIADERGYFIAGKFDQFGRNIPYASVIQAFQQMVAQILTESDVKVAHWRKALHDSLGAQAAVVVEVIPALEKLLGPQPPPPELTGEAARNRLGHVFVLMVRVFATHDHPLVLFLDDLQWADQPTLQLLELMTSSNEIGFLFVIGCYRSNEVDHGHPLRLTLDRIAQSRQAASMSALEAIELQGLGHSELQEIVRDSTRCGDDQALALADLLAAKTHGNPFFVGQFLRRLHADGVLQPDGRGGWQWDTAALGRQSMTDNVVEFMAGGLRRLPEQTQQVLQAAAVIGGVVRLVTLAAALDRPTDSVVRDLWPALEQGLLVPLDDSYRLVGSAGDAAQLAQLDARYRFLHDRVQQAAYSLLADADRPALHRKVGQALLAQAGTHRDEHIFAIVDQFHHGLACVVDAGERLELAAMMLKAGKKAQAAAAYGPGARYYEAGMALLGDAAWTDHYASAWPMTFGRAMCTYLEDRADAAELLFAELLTRSRTNVEKAVVCDLKLNLLGNRGMFKEAAKFAKQGLSYCGVSLNIGVGLPGMLVELVRVKMALRGRKAADLLQLPEMTDELRVAALQIMSNFSGPAFFLGINLYVALVLKMCQISLRYGNCPETAYCWGLYGMIVGPVLGDIGAGLQYGELQLKLAARYDSVALKPKIYHCLGGLVLHWGRHPRDCIGFVQEGLQAGLEAGDPAHAGHCSMQVINHTEWQGESLEGWYSIARKGWAFALRNRESGGTSESMQIAAAVARTLMGRGLASDPLSLTGDEFVEENWLAVAKDFEAKIPLHFYYIARMWIDLLLGDAKKAFALGFVSDKLVDTTVGLIFSTNHYYRWALAASMAYPDLPAGEQRKALQVLKKCVAKFKNWAEHNPAGLQARHLLLCAELERTKGNIDAMQDHYEAAILAASKGGFLDVRAVACERVGRWNLLKNRQRVGRLYLTEARNCYQQWGATAKITALHHEFPNIFVVVSESVAPLARVATPSADLDVLTVTKAAEAISGEIELDRLLLRLLQIALETSGARRAVLAFERKGTVYVEAERGPNDAQGLIVANVTVEQRSDLPLTVFQYVLRSRESVVMQDVHGDLGHFKADAYLQKAPTKSLLATPIVRHGQAKGLLYLEHDLLAGAFTPKRLQLLALLSGQLAISVENAELYRDQKRAADAFARFVPRQFLAYLGKESVVDIALGDAVQRDMAVLFSDIRSFTTLSESMTPVENFRFLNAYLRRMGPTIRQHNGFIDKYIGDAVMALFAGEPGDAVRAAIDMHRQVADYNKSRLVDGFKPIAIGVGLHAGPLMLGTIGEHERMDGTVIADAVNVAARLEGLTKTWKAPILISGPTLAQAQAHGKATFKHRFLGTVQLRGKTTGVDVCEVYDQLPDERQVALDSYRAEFEQAVRLHGVGEFGQSAAIFERIVRESPADGPAGYYLDLAQRQVAA